MDPQTLEQQTPQWHRRFAVDCNNRAWQLASQENRSDDDNREMRDAAHAASFHWGKVGTSLHRARADVALAQVYAMLGQGAEALVYARASLQFFTAGHGEDWDLAFAYMVMAHAAAVLGDDVLHASHYAAAQRQGAAIADQEDREIFLAELAKIPSVVLSSGSA